MKGSAPRSAAVVIPALPVRVIGWSLLLTVLLLAAGTHAQGQVQTANRSATPAEAAIDRPVVLDRAHAHNDYLHPRPLLDALSRGFGSVEVDIHLVGDELLVAHDPDEVVSGRTLERLYLAPLRQWVIENDGVVHRGGRPLILLIDIKTDAEATYARLHPLLRRYADIFTIHAGDQVVDAPVIAVISGNRPRSALLAAPVRFASYDGRLSDLTEAAQLQAGFMPLVSDNWRTVTTWDGEGDPPAGLADRLRSLVDDAHGQGRRLRFWGAPDRPAVWSLLFEAGVDLINTDDLDGLREFLVASSEEVG